MACCSIAEAKTRLEQEGFLVIPKERVLKLQQNYGVTHLMRAQLGSEWSSYRERLLVNMGTWIGRKIVEDRACVVSEDEVETPGSCDTLVRVVASVIIPKAGT
jgi:hypothetical protein